MDAEATRLLQLVVAAAEQALRANWSAAANLIPVNRNAAVGPRSTVVRCLLRSDKPDPPLTVIVKSPRGVLNRAYDPADTTPQSAAGRLLNDWAGALSLSEATPNAPLCARVYAGDATSGVLVLEDLGRGPSLADVLRDGDPARAAAALEQYASGLGRLHAATVGRTDDFFRTREALGLNEAERDRFVGAWTSQNLPLVGQLCRDLGAPWAATTERELEVVVTAIGEPGPFEALSQGDTCPDNNRLIDHGVRFFDFEYCGFRHALLDAAFLWLPFPTCQDVKRLPAEPVRRAEAAYRAHLSVGGLAAVDDAQFSRGMMHARAWWTMLSLGAYLPRAMPADQQVGTATLRQRLLLWLETFAAGTQATGYLEALGEVARSLHGTLRARWEPEADLPVYPAFATCVSPEPRSPTQP